MPKHRFIAKLCFYYVSSRHSLFLGDSNSSPVLIPYPSFEANRLRPNQTNYNSNIVSVFRLKVDVCDRLWFVDTGLIDITGAYNQVIPPRLFIVDLRTDQLIRSFTFNSSYTSADTLFGGNIVVDVTADTCDQAYAYIPDFGGYRMVVYSYETNSAWRIKHPYFYFDPFASPFNIDGELFLWTDGVFGAALSPIQNDGFRTLYFTSLSSNYQFAVSTRVLRDRNIATNITTLLQAYRFLGQRGPNMQTTAHMLDERTGTLFYTLVNRNGMGCWNTVRYANNYSPDTNFILATDDEAMIFPNDIIFDEADNLWLLSDRLPVSNNRGLSANDVNFRLFSAPIGDLIRGTPCDPNDSSTITRFGDTPSEFPDKKVGSLEANIKAGGSTYGTSKGTKKNTTSTTSRPQTKAPSHQIKPPSRRPLH